MSAGTAQPPAQVYGRFPLLRTERLLLRSIEPQDAAAVFALFSDPAVTQYYDLETFREPAQAEALIERFRQRFSQHIGIRWGIALASQPQRLVGTCGFNLWLPASQRAILGYDLSRAHWRRGIMREALQRVLDFGFQTMGLNRVEALVLPGNAASRRLLSGLGFSEEGVLREYELIKGEHVDMVMHALLRRDRPVPTPSEQAPPCR